MTPFRRTSVLLVLLLGLAALLVAPGAARAKVLRPRMVEPLVSAEVVPPHALHLPANAAARQPLRVLVALHGMGGDGSSFAAPLLAQADRNGWAVLAPTFRYGDWRDPEQVRRDDTAFIAQLKTLLDTLPSRTGLQFQPRVALYGFSRGGQFAHRFASFHPRSVLGVASLSCGTFTLPYTRGMPEAESLPLSFPFGLADVDRYTGRPLDLDNLRRVSFLIGVGAGDTQAADLPRQWDHLGTTRVARAQTYHRALVGLGVPAQLLVFPNTAHHEHDEMRARALGFLAGLTP